MRNSLLTGLTALSLLAAPAFAQQAPVGEQVVASSPGKVAATSTVSASALVTGIDKATRTLTLKGPKGKVFDVVAGDEVRNFDQISVGDEVRVDYVQALTLDLKKGGGVRSRTESADVARAAPGEKPAGVASREISVIADVIDVSPKKKTITVKGPKGGIVELKVANPDHFKVVKKGDQIVARYVEALAVAVEPAKK